MSTFQFLYVPSLYLNLLQINRTDRTCYVTITIAANIINSKDTYYDAQKHIFPLHFF